MFRTYSRSCRFELSIRARLYFPLPGLAILSCTNIVLRLLELRTRIPIDFRRMLLLDLRQ